MSDGIINLVKELRASIAEDKDELLSSLEEKLLELIAATSNVSENNMLVSEIEQKNIINTWNLLKLSGHIYSDFDDVGFRVFSQNNEDGILLYLFTVLGVKNKLAVEIGANCNSSRVGIPECNTANLVVNHGWNSLIIDGADDNVGQLIHFFASALNTKHFHWWGRKSLRPDESYYHTPLVRQEFVTRENFNELLAKNKFTGDIDLLSIDVDGMDYWVWECLDVASPRVVVIEYNNRIAPELSVTVPYSADYEVNLNQDRIRDFNGSSLLALKKLGEKKGYTLVGVNNNRINAFFVRNDVLGDKFIPLNIADLYQDQKSLAFSKEDFFSDYKNLMEWV